MLRFGDSGSSANSAIVAPSSLEQLGICVNARKCQGPLTRGARFGQIPELRHASIAVRDLMPRRLDAGSDLN